MPVWAAALSVIAVILGGCVTGAPGDDPRSGTTTTSTSPATTTTSPTSPGPSPTGSPWDDCNAETPCDVPSVDGSPDIVVLTNGSYALGEPVHVRIRNDGVANYTYSTTQASCELGIYDVHGRRLSMGVCSDAYFYAQIAPGDMADHWTWRQTECIGSGPWYGGCDEPQPVPAGTYHLRQTFCTSDGLHGTSTQGASNCTAAGDDVVVA